MKFLNDLNINENSLKNGRFEEVSSLPSTNLFVGRQVVYNNKIYIYTDSGWISTSQIKYKTTKEWETENPILLKGEMGYDSTSKRYKIGDGVNNWKNLEYTTINGKSKLTLFKSSTKTNQYDGTADLTIVPSDVVGAMDDGSADITDNTEFITSNVNGFNYSGSVNVPYRRKATYLWNWIKNKTKSLMQSMEVRYNSGTVTPPKSGIESSPYVAWSFRTCLKFTYNGEERYGLAVTKNNTVTFTYKNVEYSFTPNGNGLMILINKSANDCFDTITGNYKNWGQLLIWGYYTSGYNTFHDQRDSSNDFHILRINPVYYEANQINNYFLHSCSYVCPWATTNGNHAASGFTSTADAVCFGNKSQDYSQTFGRNFAANSQTFGTKPITFGHNAQEQLCISGISGAKNTITIGGINVSEDSVVIGKSCWGLNYGGAVIGYANYCGGTNITMIGVKNTTKSSNPHYSTCVGYQNILQGWQSTVIGYACQCLGNYSTAIGWNTIVSHNSAVALGNGCKTSANGQFVLGTYNALTTEQFIIGNGASDTNRKNIFTITSSGKVTANGGYAIPNGTASQVLLANGSTNTLKTIGGNALLGTGDIVFKTINNQALIGSGNISIEEDSHDVALNDINEDGLEWYLVPVCNDNVGIDNSNTTYLYAKNSTQPDENRFLYNRELNAISCNIYASEYDNSIIDVTNNNRSIDFRNIVNILYRENIAYIYSLDDFQNWLITLNGSNTAPTKSISTMISEGIAKVVANAPASFDTLKEIADWISTHQNDASAMNTAINNNTTNITNLTTKVNTNTTNISANENQIHGIKGDIISIKSILQSLSNEINTLKTELQNAKAEIAYLKSIAPVVTAEDGFYVVDANDYIGFKVDNNGATDSATTIETTNLDE